MLQGQAVTADFLTRAVKSLCCDGTVIRLPYGLACSVCNSVGLSLSDGIFTSPGSGAADSEGLAYKLNESVKMSGWRSGFFSFLNAIEPSLADTLRHFAGEKQTGWRFFLDISADKSALVMESGMNMGAPALARNFRHVVAVYRDANVAGCARVKAREDNIENLDIVLLKDLKRLPFKDAAFDAVIINDIEGGFPGEASGGPVDADALIGESSRVLNDRGFLFAAWSNTNPFYLRLRKGGNKTKIKKTSGFSSGIAGVEASTRKAGFSESSMMLLDPGMYPAREIRPIRLEGGNDAVRNPNIKKWLISRLKDTTLRQWLLHAFAVSARKKSDTPSFIEALRERIEAASGRSNLQLLSYRLGNPSVVIVMFGEGGAGMSPSMVARLPLTPHSLERCRRNVRAISAISGGSTVLSPMVPRLVESGELKGQAYFVETAVNGGVVDSHDTAISGIINDAVSALTSFHLQTLRETRIDEAVFSRLLGGIFDSISPYVDEEARDEFAGLTQAIKERLLGQTIPLVFMHGDYKDENIIIGHDDKRINGIIDWDLSEEEGLPLLDVCYLLSYRNLSVGNMALPESIVGKLMPLKEGSAEFRIIGSYCSALGIKAEFCNPLIAAFWLHHIGRRIGVDLRASRHWMEGNFYRVLPVAKRLLSDSVRFS